MPTLLEVLGLPSIQKFTDLNDPVRQNHSTDSSVFRAELFQSAIRDRRLTCIFYIVFVYLSG